MSTVLEVLRPGFLLRDALLASILVGVVCPLVGVYFVLRRMIFLGVALPQLSAAGIAFALLMHRTMVGPHPHGGASDSMMARLGATGFTLIGILTLAALERRGRHIVEARIGMVYAIAGALTILFLAADPWGEAHIVNLLKGELLAARSLPSFSALSSWSCSPSKRSSCSSPSTGILPLCSARRLPSGIPRCTCYAA
jgi:ABC-type Mn2+/Zn2+ transport system permease subunit